MPAGRGRGRHVGRAEGTGNAAHRSRAGMARTRQRASHPDAAVACHCQTDLSAGGRAAGSSRSALGRRCQIVQLRRTTTKSGKSRRVLQVGWQGVTCRAGTGSRCGRSSLTDADALLAPALNSFLPEHSVSTCRPAGCRSRLWATSCAPARRVRAADCHHLPVWRLAGYATCGRRAGLAATRSVKCEILRGYWWDYPRQLPGYPACSVPVCRKMAGIPVGVRAKHRLHRSHISGIWPGTAGKLY